MIHEAEIYRSKLILQIKKLQEKIKHEKKIRDENIANYLNSSINTPINDNKLSDLKTEFETLNAYCLEHINYYQKRLEKLESEYYNIQKYLSENRALIFKGDLFKNLPVNKESNDETKDIEDINATSDSSMSMGPSDDGLIMLIDNNSNFNIIKNIQNSNSEIPKNKMDLSEIGNTTVAESHFTTPAQKSDISFSTGSPKIISEEWNSLKLENYVNYRGNSPPAIKAAFEDESQSFTSTTTNTTTTNCSSSLSPPPSVKKDLKSKNENSLPLTQPIFLEKRKFLSLNRETDASVAFKNHDYSLKSNARSTGWLQDIFDKGFNHMKCRRKELAHLFNKYGSADHLNIPTSSLLLMINDSAHTKNIDKTYPPHQKSDTEFDFCPTSSAKKPPKHARNYSNGLATKNLGRSQTGVSDSCSLKQIKKPKSHQIQASSKFYVTDEKDKAVLNSSFSSSKTQTENAASPLHSGEMSPPEDSNLPGMRLLLSDSNLLDLKRRNVPLLDKDKYNYSSGKDVLKYNFKQPLILEGEKEDFPLKNMTYKNFIDFTWLEMDKLFQLQNQDRRNLESLRIKNQQDYASFNESINEIRLRNEHLNESITENTELQQSENENLKLDIKALEEKISYQIDDRTQDIIEMMENIQTRISKLELAQQRQQLVSLEGLEMSAPRNLLLKSINILIAFLQLILLLISTIAQILSPFIKTRSRTLFTLTTSLIFAFLLKIYPNLLKQSLLFLHRKFTTNSHTS